MQRIHLVVRSPQGLHLRTAAAIVRLAQQFRSSVQLRCGEKVADLRSILSILALCATMGTGLDLEACGDDETEAVQAIERVFAFPPVADVAEPPPGTTGQR